AHGVEPILPFDITQATFLLPDITARLPDAELLAIRAWQLERREEDLELLHNRVLDSRFTSIRAFEKAHTKSIREHNCRAGDLVLVLNKRIEKGISKKCLPRYFRPMMVIKRSTGGNYQLADLNGAISRIKYAAFRIIPYHARSPNRLRVTEFLEPEGLAVVESEE
ncbi:hypothetical protein K435DRAFT_567803, partial [Dendrothele bispora CBS 962.96]